MITVASIKDGLIANSCILYAKSMLCGFSSIYPSSALSASILSSATPLIICQRGITTLTI